MATFMVSLLAPLYAKFMVAILVMDLSQEVKNAAGRYVIISDLLRLTCINPGLLLYFILPANMDNFIYHMIYKIYHEH